MQLLLQLSERSSAVFDKHIHITVVLWVRNLAGVYASASKCNGNNGEDTMAEHWQ